ncbi:MAG: DEAD/DEAH box helicase family protein [Chloroflexota bacterium]|nr:DEAD/DEAH box helicase family protein [Chloroflexota bacterium]MDE2907964.1 DEAD/DEAH box helicase family protein [Chloroflexota bacterium]
MAARNPAQMSYLEDHGATASAVPAISHEVNEWRDGGYKGATETSRILLNYWFHSDHRLRTGEPFAYYAAQQKAVESLIYVYEVAKARNLVSLYRQYIPQDRSDEIRFPLYDDFARYCTKMATGSGKTKVMALAIAWQYFNAVRENSADYAKTFLVIAPNVIVFERLRGDFAGGRIFQNDPIIPKEFQIFWDMQFYMRGDAERGTSEGALYLTNIQQLYDRENRQKDDEPEVMTAVLGNKPPANLDEEIGFPERIIERAGSPVLALNDEAHHTHDPESAWNKTIRALHDGHSSGLSAQLDFSATPRYSKGALFPWTISDYPLRQAIRDNIVKNPVKGITDIGPMPSNDTAIKYEPYIIAGIERWREYREQLESMDKKPLLFIMMNKTREADDIAAYLRRKFPDEFAGDKTLVIHTDRKGEVSKRDLDIARKAAKEVDLDESSINAIVSVLMLREGWDVQNVTVIVGLRPYTSKANILPEQTIGRGLRLMFRNLRTPYQERVDIIGNPAFINFVEELEKEEDYEFDTWRVGKDKLQITVIKPELDKAEYDVALPSLSPILARTTTLQEEIESLDVANLYRGEPLPITASEDLERTFLYEGKDLLTSKTLFERIYTIRNPQSSQEVVAYYANLIAKEVKLPSQFAALAPKARDYLKYHAFGREVDLDSPEILGAISQKLHQMVMITAFRDALQEKLVQPQEPVLEGAGRKLSSVEPFPWSQAAPVCRKTVFNRVACDSNFEVTFAQFLDRARDVVLFGKLPLQFGFSIPYTDSRGNLRHYYPDFVVVDDKSVSYLVETKGLEDIEVANKDRSATIWAEQATGLTGQEWRYVKILQTDFLDLAPASFADCIQMGLTQSSLID